MIKVKFLFLPLLILVFLACNQATQSVEKVNVSKPVPDTSVSSTLQTDNTNKDSLFEQKIIDTILKLKEVKERSEYIEQQTNGDRHLLVWIVDTPHLPEQEYFWIKAGEDNGMSLVTHFDFYVYPGSMKILYYNIEKDSILTLEDWRKTKSM